METTQQLTSLLTRWAELEPGQCRKVAKICHSDPDAFRLLFHEDYHVITPGEISFFAIVATLEYAIREAIIARGWLIEISGPRFGRPEWVAGVSWVKDGRTVWTDGKHEQPAIALLMAYLEALEDQNDATTTN